MLFLEFPTEIVLLVAESIPLERDLSSLTRTNRRLHSLLSTILLKNNMQNSDSSSLYWAARNGKLVHVQRMVELGADVSATADGLSPLDHAVCEGHADVVKYLLEKGAPYRWSETRPWTPLCAAAAAGFTEIVQILLDHHGPERGTQKEDDLKALKDSPSWANWRVVKSLFHTNLAGIERERFEYTVPLFMAIAGGHCETAEVLMKDKRVDVNYRDRVDRSPLIWALSHGHENLVTPLLQNGADANVQNRDTGETLLVTAIREHKLSLLRSYLAQGVVDPNLTDRNFRTPLWAALDSWHRTDILQELLARPDLDVNKKASVADRTRGGLTPLLHAIRERQEKVARMLLEHPTLDSTSINSTDDQKRTPLSYAAQYGLVELINILLSKGADPQLADQDGRVPHSYAAERGHAQAIRNLVQTGRVPIDAADSQGQAPIFWAIRGGNVDMVETLVEIGADPNQQDKAGSTPLICLVKRSARKPTLAPDDEQAITFLLNQKANPSIRDAEGMTALDWACKYKWGELMAGLVKSSPSGMRIDEVDSTVESIIAASRSNSCAAYVQRRVWKMGVGAGGDWEDMRQ
ncbi:ankyrin repeat domain-containing protein [Aspergillus mulundensis]|uniref:Uncharacterized protein n=1 Tax=Aspergillus mulundensis TaxID=1810919 RepID=A0A3D8RXS1_9EURO|nr:hypothetical protein DSM5745_05711 [Aspergillus mulundensis]RDW78859.1 hypothetical protein DSM5745_05711 [Aspergillus mulundensis]